MGNESKADIKDRSYKFAVGIIVFIDKLSKDSSSQIIAKQLIRSATSVGANIVEAQASPSKRDFTNFLNHALKSANETKYWLALLKDSNKIDPQTISPLLQEAKELANILASSIITLRGKRF